MRARARVRASVRPCMRAPAYVYEREGETDMMREWILCVRVDVRRGGDMVYGCGCGCEGGQDENNLYLCL